MASALSQSSSDDETVQGIEVGTKSMDTDQAQSSGMSSTIDALLQRQRNELMFELRRLQMGDRPVTGQGNKEAIEQFLQQGVGNGGQVPQPEVNRPEHILVEVNALVERRPVSSVLESRGFRRNLENALRGAISNLSARHASRNATPLRSSQTVRQNHSSLAPSTDGSTSRASPVPVAAPRPSLETRSSVPITPAPLAMPTLTSNSESNTLPAQVTTQPLEPFAEQWLNQRHQPETIGQRAHIWDQIEDAQREELIAEISELVHRQIVSNTLSGNFRNNLESTLRSHVEGSEQDGHRVVEFIRSLPRTHGHVRNDFSELGIAGGELGADVPVAVDAHSDEMSVVSATAAVTVPYAQSNAALSREVSQLKAQLAEMRNMMQLQLDMTLDLQRAVRQEVSAAIHTAQSNAVQDTTTTSPSQARSVPVDDTLCLICLDARADSVLYQCGHLCMCYTCGLNLQRQQQNPKCPMCRAPIRDIIRCYRPTAE